MPQGSSLNMETLLTARAAPELGRISGRDLPSQLNQVEYSMHCVSSDDLLVKKQGNVC